MKDPADRHTRDLLDAPSSPGARRQASYAQRQRDAGRRQRTFWLTNEEAERVRKFVEQLRDNIPKRPRQSVSINTLSQTDMDP